MTARTNKSKIVVDALLEVLANSYHVYAKTHLYHWNVTGEQFAALHTMFGEQYTELWQALDVIAERVRALGETVPPSFNAPANVSIKADQRAIVSAPQMLKNLVQAQTVLAKNLRHGVETAERAGDVGTADLLTERLQVAEKTRWMLQASL